MGTRIYYTHRQACLLLNVDGKTLNAWLKAAQMEMQPDPKDRRSVRIPRTQLQRLATLHGLTLPGDEVLSEDLEHARSLTALTLEIEVLAQEQEALAALAQTLPQRIEDTLKVAVAHALHDHLSALQERVQAVEDAVHETQFLFQQQLTQLSHRLELVQEQLASPTQNGPTRARPAPVGRTRGQASRKQGEEGGQEEQESGPEGGLPPGTVSIRSFAEVHGSTRDMIMAAIERRDLEAITRSSGGTSHSFLSPEQQDAAVVYLERKQLAVRRCPHCPHATLVSPNR